MLLDRSRRRRRDGHQHRDEDLRNYRNSHEALYAADAAVERVVQDLLMVPRWNDILDGTAQSGFSDGADDDTKALPGGGTISSTRPRRSCRPTRMPWPHWGANNPQWRLFAWGPLRDIAPDLEIDSPMYVAVWIADDPAETDGDPTADTNGTLTLHARSARALRHPQGDRGDGRAHLEH